MVVRAQIWALFEGLPLRARLLVVAQLLTDGAALAPAVLPPPLAPRAVATSDVGVTPKQLDMLGFIVRFYAENDVPPTLRAIGRAFGLSSTNGVNDYLKALERKGLIERVPGLSRGIRITAKGRSAVA